MSPLTTPIFDVHWVISATPLTSPTRLRPASENQTLTTLTIVTIAATLQIVFFFPLAVVTPQNLFE